MSSSDKPEYYLYLITNKINNKKYVGYTSRSIVERFREHCCSDMVIGRAIKKHGRNNFEIRPISSAVKIETAKLFEQRLIATFDSFGRNGYNLTPGGDRSSPKANKLKKGVSPYNKDKCSFETVVEEKLRDQKYFINCIQQGMSAIDVSKTLNISAESVRLYAKKLNVTFPRNTKSTHAKIRNTLLERKA